MINFSSYVPYYIQLRDHLKERISAREWSPGQKLPGENDLCQEFHVSRTVVRQALLELELEGYIVRRKGRGTFVTGPKISESLAQKLTGFYSDMVEQGLKPTSQVLQHRIIPADERIARLLEIEPGTPVFEICRLRYVNGDPVALVTSYLPQSLCPKLEGFDLTDRSLYEFLENDCRLILARAHRTIEAATAGEGDAGLLDILPSDPVIRLESVSYLESGAPIEYFHAYQRGDRTKFEIDLIRVHDRWRTLE